MEQTNSVYFEHNGGKYSATVKEDIGTEPKVLLITPNDVEELDGELKFESIEGEWVGPQKIRDEFPETYASLLRAIKAADYV
ncbi:MAG TPA: hypothetical protein VM935_19505 [Chitinophagaceae bacterium]|jgi:hypothetical protein|nr:hypothetical protein [Chitinophagaceae bacterium]